MSSEKKPVATVDVIDARSPANRYLVDLLEDKGSISFEHPTEERIQAVFDVLDLVTPQLGVFSKVLGLIKAELHGAIYSPRVADGQVGIPPETLPKVSYFSLVRRLQSERNEDVEKVQSQLQAVEATLLSREKELRCAREEGEALQERIKGLEATIPALQLEVKQKSEAICKLQEEVKVHTRLLEEERQTHACSTAAAQDQLNAAQDQIHQLEKSSREYGSLQKTFLCPPASREQNVLSPIGGIPAGHPVLANQAHVTYYLQSNRHVYEQLLWVQNKLMDDFDSLLDEQDRPSVTDDVPCRKLHIEEFVKVKRMFLARMAEISTELSLLSQQRESLEQHSQRTCLPGKQVSPTSQNGPPGATESPEVTDSESMGEFFRSALYPDERLLSRYSAMIYASTDNRRIYQELAGSSMCTSCGEKTFLCPHKIGGTNEIHLPKNCTHIKICRPHVHQTALATKLAGSRLNRGTEAVCAGTEEGMEKRLNVKRGAPRSISLDLCLNLSEQLMGTILHQATEPTQGSGISSIQDVLWGVVKKRYIDKEISCLGLQDLLAALQRYSVDSKVLRVLDQVLRCELDCTVLLYVLLHTEMLNWFPVTEISQLQLFMEQSFPFLQETDQDALVLEFTSYSGRSVSPVTTLGFILHLILQHREPLILQCEDLLTRYANTQHGYLSLEELADSLDKLMHLGSKTQTQSVIQQSARNLRSNLIPIQNAAQIAAYLVKRENRMKPEKLQTRNKENKHTSGTGNDKHLETHPDARDWKSLCRVLGLSDYKGHICSLHETSD